MLAWSCSMTPSYVWAHQDEIVNEDGTSAVLSYRHMKPVSGEVAAEPGNK